MWLSRTLAGRFRALHPEGTAATLTIDVVRARVEPSQIDNYLQSHEIVLGPAIRSAIAARSKYVLILSPTRAMAMTRVSARRSRGQSDDATRVNYHVRSMLGITATMFERRPPVEIAPFGTVRARNRSLESARRVAKAVLRSPLVLLEVVARVFLNAPRVTLASEESSISDDSHGVVRVSANTCQLLGIQSGDRVYVTWGPRKVVARAFEESRWEYDESYSPEIVDWTPLRRSMTVGLDSRITVPAKLRTELGAPRNSILVVRRSVLSRVRRHLIALTVPIVGILITVFKLGLGILPATILTVIVLVLTLAGERVSEPNWRRWP